MTPFHSTRLLRISMGIQTTLVRDTQSREVRITIISTKIKVAITTKKVIV